MTGKDGYVLRKAAGAFWLIDTAQQGAPYHAPLGMNESGAQIWQLAQAGMTPEQIAARLAEPDGITPEEVRTDVEIFLEQVRAWMEGGGAASCEEEESFA